MADRRHIEGMLKKKMQEIQELEEKIKESQVYVQALQDVLKRFPKEPGSESAAAASLRPGSMVAQARDTILKAGKALHVDDILRAQGKELSRENRTGLAGSLSAYVRKNIIFTRTAPNTFGLEELAKRLTELDDSPPPDFGVEPPSDDDEMPF